MLKAVFFDWFNTLANYHPPREEIYYKAFKEAGFEIPLKVILRALLSGDQQYFIENAKRPVRERSPEDQFEVYTCYPRAMMAGAGLSASAELGRDILKKVLKEYKAMNLALYDDVLPTFKSLKERKLILGVITNADTRFMSGLSEKLGITQYVSFIATSQDAGADKPAPQIFRLGLERAGVKAEEAMHVGDQYPIDVKGARGVGIKPVLIDRYDLSSEVTDCPRITTLNELSKYLT